MLSNERIINVPLENIQLEVELITDTGVVNNCIQEWYAVARPSGNTHKSCPNERYPRNAKHVMRASIERAPVEPTAEELQETGPLPPTELELAERAGQIFMTIARVIPKPGDSQNAKVSSFITTGKVGPILVLTAQRETDDVMKMSVHPDGIEHKRSEFMLSLEDARLGILTMVQAASEATPQFSAVNCEEHLLNFEIMVSHMRLAEESGNNEVVKQQPGLLEILQTKSGRKIAAMIMLLGATLGSTVTIDQVRVGLEAVKDAVHNVIESND